MVIEPFADKVRLGVFEEKIDNKVGEDKLLQVVGTDMTVCAAGLVRNVCRNGDNFVVSLQNVGGMFGAGVVDLYPTSREAVRVTAAAMVGKYPGCEVWTRVRGRWELLVGLGAGRRLERNVVVGERELVSEVVVCSGGSLITLDVLEGGSLGGYVQRLAETHPSESMFVLHALVGRPGLTGFSQD